MKVFPVQIQADNADAADAAVPCMAHVFDPQGLACLMQALSRVYLHVIAWDAEGQVIAVYDNRS